MRAADPGARRSSPVVVGALRIPPGRAAAALSYIRHVALRLSRRLALAGASAGRLGPIATGLLASCLLVACADRPSPAPTLPPFPAPPPAPLATPPPARAAPAPPPPGPEATPYDPARRGFRLRARVTGVHLCRLMGIAPLPGDAAWISGACNLRLYVGPRGARPQLADNERLHFDFPPGECAAHWTFPAIVAGGPDDARVLAEQSCGLDPSLLWPRPIQRFDGTRWKDVPGRAPGQSLWRLAATSDGALWGLATGDAVTSPNEAVYRWTPIGWQPLSLTLRDDTHFDAQRFAVTESGEVWLPDREAKGVWRGAARSGWTFHALPKGSRWCHDVVVGEDGAPYVVCDRGTHRWDGTAFALVGPGGRSAWPRSARDIIVADEERRVVHFDGTAVTPIQIEEPQLVDELELRGAGGRVWAMGGLALWSLTEPGEDVPPPHDLPLQFPATKP